MFENNIIQISNRSTTNINLHIYYCGSEECSPNKSWGSKIVDHFLIYYIHEGKGILQVNNVKYDLHEGQGFLVSPNTVTYFVADNAEPWKYSWVGFSGNIATEYLYRANLSVNSPTYTDKNDDGFLEECFENMIEFAKFGLGHNRYCKMMAVLYNIIAYLRDIADKEAVKEKLIDSEFYYVRKALEYIKMNFSKEISISEISRYVNIDRKYLHHVFKNNLNMSPQKYVINYRMKKACELMKNSMLSISGIARSVGYKDQFQFSKMFKKTIGISPSQYKRNLKNDNSSTNENKDNQIRLLNQIIEQKDREINELKQFINDHYNPII